MGDRGVAAPESTCKGGRLDKSNAFCNVQRGWLPQVTPVEQGDFYAHPNVFVQSPFGLVGPYKLLHGGPQGDTMGLGGFKKLINVWTNAVNVVIVSEGLRPESGRPGGLGPKTWCPSHPAMHAEQVPHVSSTVDCRIASFVDAASLRVLPIGLMSCMAGNGAINNTTLKV